MGAILMKISFLRFVLCMILMQSALALADPFEDVYVKYKARQYDEAINLADDYIKKNPGDQEFVGSLVFIKVLCTNEKGDTASFEQMAKEFDVRYPGNKYAGDVQANLIGMYYKQKKFAEVKRNANEYLEKYGQKKSKNTERVEWFLVAAWVYSGDNELVEPFVTKLLTERPQHTQRSNLLLLDAQASLNAKQYPKAYDKFMRLANADPDENICRKARFHAANAAFELANQLRVNNEPRELVEKQYKIALELFEKFQGAAVGDKSMWTKSETRMIQCYRQLGKYDSLDSAVKSALSKPEHQVDKGLILYEHGYSYYNRQQWANALECYDSLFSWSKQGRSNANFLKGREEPIDYQRALCLLNLGNQQAFDQAALDFQAKYPNSANAFRVAYAAALVPYKKENWAASTTSLQAFLQKNQQAPEELKLEAEYNLVSSMLLANEFENVKQFVQKKLSAAPDYSGRQGLQFLNAMTDYRAGKWSEASASLCKLIEQSPEGEVAANAKLYVGLCKMNEARQKKSSGSKKEVTTLQHEGRKYLSDWATSNKPVVHTDLDALYCQNDFAGIKQEASKYLDSKDESSPLKKSQMLNWMGIVSINQNPPDLKNGEKYFNQAYQVAVQDKNNSGPETAKACSWMMYIALYKDDQEQVDVSMRKFKDLPDSVLKTEICRSFQFVKQSQQ